jgi:hypothetical protein
MCSACHQGNAQKAAKKRKKLMNTKSKGEMVEFTAIRPCKFRGTSYKAGDRIRIVLAVDWREEEGIGQGGPWGWGGYTSRLLNKIALHRPWPEKL